MANKKKSSIVGKKGVKGGGQGIVIGAQSIGTPVTVEKVYLQIGRSLGDVEESQMFGKSCFKVNGKAFMCLFDNCVVFKLTGKTHERAIGLKGSKLFDPSGKGRAMKEWVEVKVSNKSNYKDFAKAAMNYVMSTTE
jgi:hypothetical protein